MKISQLSKLHLVVWILLIGGGSSLAAIYPGHFRLPFDGEFVITSGPSVIENRYHAGSSAEAVDFQSKSRDPFNVFAVYSGTAHVLIGENDGLGNTVMIDHGDGIWSLYAHLGRVAVSNGQSLDTGDYLGETGNSGSGGAGNHLHFELRKNVIYRNSGSPNPFSGSAVSIVDHPNIDYKHSLECCHRGLAHWAETSENADGMQREQEEGHYCSMACSSGVGCVNQRSVAHGSTKDEAEARAIRSCHEDRTVDTGPCYTERTIEVDTPHCPPMEP